MKPRKIVIRNSKIIIRSFEGNIFGFCLKKFYTLGIGKFEESGTESKIKFTDDRVFYKTKVRGDYLSDINISYDRFVSVFGLYESYLKRIKTS